MDPEEIISEEETRTRPVGFRFLPTDEDLILYYLRPKLAGEPDGFITFFDLQSTEPYNILGPDVDEGYFFSPKLLKHSGGRRRERTAGAGTWRLFGKTENIYLGGELLGTKKSLSFGINGVKNTGYVMHEYECHGTAGDLVLCRIKRNNADTSSSSSSCTTGRKRRRDDGVHVEAGCLQVQEELVDEQATPIRIEYDKNQFHGGMAFQIVGNYDDYDQNMSHGDMMLQQGHHQQQQEQIHEGIFDQQGLQQQQLSENLVHEGRMMMAQEDLQLQEVPMMASAVPSYGTDQITAGVVMTPGAENGMYPYSDLMSDDYWLDMMIESAQGMEVISPPPPPPTQHDMVNDQGMAVMSPPPPPTQHDMLNEQDMTAAAENVSLQDYQGTDYPDARALEASGELAKWQKEAFPELAAGSLDTWYETIQGQLSSGQTADDQMTATDEVLKGLLALPPPRSPPLRAGLR